ERGEVIVFKYPNDTTQRYIKRIIGLPEETIEIKDGKILIYKNNSMPEVLDESDYISSDIQTTGNLKIALGSDEYFVLGDNRPVSSDSRRWGVVPRKDIIGKVYFRAWPITAMTKIELPAY
ncbi:signal peptidase I, partial [Patescibacteria group bacterium]|nr:signal peptidase I [Patescibacteria group bacterium]